MEITLLAVGRLRPAAQQVVSIARALSHDVRLLIMDEPSAILDDEEVETIVAGLDSVRERIGEHGFQFAEADEDIHMAVERLLGEEIGPLACYLASPLSDFVTGTVFVIDGGESSKL